tara:strand:+ start:94 stop:576 length:483 start_codon:yes stop_codon:yes gene_type:complete
MNKEINSIYNISIQSIDDKLINLQDYKGLYILFVNVASYCGYTKQYSDLQKLQDDYQNIKVIGLPCNQFLFQEPFSEKRIKQFCSINYNISFLMTKKIKVKGKFQHNLYKWLTSKDLNSIKDSVVKWNFQKYLVSKNGQLIDCFYSKTPPLSEHITKHLI